MSMNWNVRSTSSFRIFVDRWIDF